MMRSQQHPLSTAVGCLALLPICLAFAGPARAEWVAVYANAEASFYIDPASMRKEGALLKVAGLQDLKQRDVDRAMSRRAQAEYDCQRGRYRLVSLVVYAEPRARGKVLWSMDANPDGWTTVPPGTGVDAILELACTQ